MSLVNSDDREPLLPSLQAAKPAWYWWWLVVLWRIMIFSITGSSSMIVTRFIVRRGLGMEPINWPYYAVFFVMELLVYTVMIILIGSCLGQWRFFCSVAFRMWYHVLPPTLRHNLHRKLIEPAL
ncbi:hypothetical protein CLU79DRAFT_736135 [Phycomyces nitens]|nr:hypothetical protein CLU79DRAFT_736135 [Phycomyces nitens]